MTPEQRSRNMAAIKEGYEAGDDCAEISFLPGAAFPCSGQKVAGHTGYCSAKVQDRHFRQRMLLAWA